MADNDIVLSVKNVSKCFEMYEKPVHRLYQTLCAGKKKFYKEFWALKDISFEMRRGECVGIIGRNGAGKSTLLQIITGTIGATTGSVLSHGRITALLELGSGFNPEFTGRENVYMYAAVLGFDRNRTEQMYQGIVDFAGIGDFIDQPVKTYSSGMMVRLAFAVQVAADPDLLIVDEALAVGDAVFQFKCLTRIKEIIAKGASVLFVSHDSSMIKAFCDRCLWLKNGRMHRLGCVGEVVDAYDMENRQENERLERPAGSIVEREGRSGGIAVRPTLTEKWWEEVGLDDRIKGTRHGDGQAMVRGVRILTTEGMAVVSAEYDQELRIQVFFEVMKPIPRLSVYYLVNDSKHNPVLGYGSYMSDGGKMFAADPGKYMAEFRLKMPLTAGFYSVSAVLSELTVRDQVAHSFDYAENCMVFSVLPRKPDRIWSFCQVENKFSLVACE